MRAITRLYRGDSVKEAKLIVALDLPTLQEAEKWVKHLVPKVRQFKIGSILFTAEGPRAVEMVRRYHGEVFLDLKFHDIPNTVAQACRAASRLGVWMMNLHLLGGAPTLKEVVSTVNEEALRTKSRRPILLGVTLLTHLTQEVLSGVGWPLDDLREEVALLGKVAKENGLDGVVCSAEEIASLRKSCGKDFLIVVPGIRPSGSAVHDQKRIATPREAVQSGADYLVVGRPILESKDPLKTVDDILEEIR